RPSVTLRPLENLELSALAYLKFPLGNTHTINGDWDFRFDGGGRSEFSLPVKSDWAKKISIIFEYLLHYDGAPPEIPESALSDYKDNKGISLVKKTAEKKHHEFKFMMQIKF
ncbi:unnamed protein product, partial [marine sediment metagenome]